MLEVNWNEFDSDVDIASKYQVELNSKYSTYNKQGSSNGETTKDKLVQAIQQQLKNKKESE